MPRQLAHCPLLPSKSSFTSRRATLLVLRYCRLAMNLQSHLVCVAAHSTKLYASLAPSELRLFSPRIHAATAFVPLASVDFTCCTCWSRPGKRRRPRGNTVHRKIQLDAEWRIVNSIGAAA